MYMDVIDKCNAVVIDVDDEFEVVVVG